jgi:hypothetical protein
MEIDFKWELIDFNESRSRRTLRVKVLGGWIQKDEYEDYECITISTVFIPDPEHKWKIKK